MSDLIRKAKCEMKENVYLLEFDLLLWNKM